MIGSSPLKIAPRELMLALWSVVFLLLVVLAVFVGKPLYARFAVTNAELAGLRDLTDTSTSFGLAPLEQDVETLRTLLERDRKNLSAQELESYMVAAIEAAAMPLSVPDRVSRTNAVKVTARFVPV